MVFYPLNDLILFTQSSVCGGGKIFAIKKGSQKNSETLDYQLEAASGFEPENNGFAGRCLENICTKSYNMASIYQCNPIKYKNK